MPQATQAVSSINEAVRAAMDDWKRNGTLNVDVMRESIEQLVDEAIVEWQTANVDATTNEETFTPPTDAEKDEFFAQLVEAMADDTPKEHARDYVFGWTDRDWREAIDEEKAAQLED